MEGQVRTDRNLGRQPGEELLGVPIASSHFDEVAAMTFWVSNE